MLKKTRLLQPIISTLLAINFMLVALIIGAKLVTIETSIPSIGRTVKPQLRIEYGMELIGKDHITANNEGNWLVEHYKEYEYHYDEQGNLVDKRPTAKEEHLRYWQKAK